MWVLLYKSSLFGENIAELIEEKDCLGAWLFKKGLISSILSVLLFKFSFFEENIVEEIEEKDCLGVWPFKEGSISSIISGWGLNGFNSLRKDSSFLL